MSVAERLQNSKGIRSLVLDGVLFFRPKNIIVITFRWQAEFCNNEMTNDET